MSRPLMRIVGEPENARSVAMLSSITRTSRTSAATPSESRTSLTSFTAAGWDGHSATYKTSTLIHDLPFSCTAVLQNRAMGVLFAQLLIATAQRHLQFTLQLLQVFQFVPDIGQLRLQAAAHGRSRVHPASPRIQKSSNFTKLESQTLYAPDEGQCFDITFAVTAKASLRPGRSGQQRIALIKTNRVNTQPNFLSDEANLHGLRSSLEATPWSIVQSQVVLSTSEATSTSHDALCIVVTGQPKAPDKGEVGGSSPPRPTSKYASILTFPLFGDLPQKAVLSTVCQLHDWPDGTTLRALRPFG